MRHGVHGLLILILIGVNPLAIARIMSSLWLLVVAVNALAVEETTVSCCCHARRAEAILTVFGSKRHRAASIGAVTLCSGMK